MNLTNAHVRLSPHAIGNCNAASVHTASFLGKQSCGMFTSSEFERYLIRHIIAVRVTFMIQVFSLEEDGLEFPGTEPIIYKNGD